MHGDYDNSPMLYCSGVFSHKNSICFRGGWATVAHLLMTVQQLFYRFIKKAKKNNKKWGYDSSPLLLFARGVTVPSNFS